MAVRWLSGDSWQPRHSRCRNPAVRPGTSRPWPARCQPAGDPGRPTARAFHAPAGCSESGSGGATSWSSSWSRSRARPAAGHFLYLHPPLRTNTSLP